LSNLDKKKETFWTSGPLMEKLATIPEGEKSVIIRMALRDWFGLTDSRRGVVGYKEADYDKAKCN